MDTNIKLSMLVISLFLSGAFILGVSIHAFIASKRKPKVRKIETNPADIEDAEGELKYLNEIGLRDKEIATLQQQLMQSKGKANAFSVKVEELRQQKQRLQTMRERLEKRISDLEKRKDGLRKILTEEKATPLVAAR